MVNLLYDVVHCYFVCAVHLSVKGPAFNPHQISNSGVSQPSTPCVMVVELCASLCVFSIIKTIMDVEYYVQSTMKSGTRKCGIAAIVQVFIILYEQIKSVYAKFVRSNCR